MSRKGVFDMAHTVNVNIKMDEDVKKRMERACAEMGLSMSAAFTMFAKKVGREYRIPFEVSAEISECLVGSEICIRDRFREAPMRGSVSRSLCGLI